MRKVKVGSMEITRSAAKRRHQGGGTIGHPGLKARKLEYLAIDDRSDPSHNRRTSVGMRSCVRFLTNGDAHEENSPPSGRARDHCLDFDRAARFLHLGVWIPFLATDGDRVATQLASRCSVPRRH